MSDKFAEFVIHDYAIAVVHEEMREIKRKRTRTDDDIARMEKLVRIYSTLMDNLRTNIKEGLRDQLIPEGTEDGT